MDRIAGSADPSKDKARGYLAHDWLVRRFAPRWLRRAGLEDDAAMLEACAPVVDEKTAKAARLARPQRAQLPHGIRELVAYAAAAADAAAAAHAAAALKGKTYAQKKAWFRERIDAALADELEASLRDAFELLDAMLAA